MQSNRPTGVSVIAILAFLGGAIVILWGLLLLFLPIPGELAGPSVVIGLVIIVLGILEIAIGWGLWELKNWARITMVVLQALSLISGLIMGAVFLFGVDISGIVPGLGRLSFPGYGIGLWLGAAVSGVIIWYLLKPDVESAFLGADYPQDDWMPAIQPEITEVAPPPPPPPKPMPSPPPAPKIAKTDIIGVDVPAVGWLVARTGTRLDKQYPLSTSARTIIGRDGTRCQVVLDDRSVSAEHACVQWENGQFVLYDLASTNHTFLNDTRIQRQTLMDGDTIRVGNTILVLKMVQ
jgi:hypothetical protein